VLVRAIAFSAVIALCGCASSSQAKSATDIFHQMMDRGEYAAIYDNARPEFRATVGRDVLIAVLTRVHRKMGSCQQSPASVTGMTVNTSGSFVTTASNRYCENGYLAEQFGWMVIGGNPVLLSYNANSPMLLTD
jgi:hypothetical protein